MTSFILVEVTSKTNGEERESKQIYRRDKNLNTLLFIRVEYLFVLMLAFKQNKKLLASWSCKSLQI